jgi:hypothetical protein
MFPMQPTDDLNLLDFFYDIFNPNNNKTSDCDQSDKDTIREEDSKV